jgi:ABC-type multidrug transport system fused ATPase/permease subunit
VSKDRRAGLITQVRPSPLHKVQSQQHQEETRNMNVLATSFGDGDVLLWMFEFFMFVIWFWLLIAIFSDLFRDHDTSGGAKALWVIFVVVVPFVGILVYLLVRGHGMAERSAKAQARAQEQMNAQIRAAAGSGPTASAADQIAQAKALLDSGAIDQGEFDKLKTAALAS